MKRTRGNISAQSSNEPVAHLARIPNQYSLPLSPRWRMGPTCQHRLLPYFLSLTLCQWKRPELLPPVISHSNDHQEPTYKSLQMPSVDPLSSSCPRRHLGNAIARRILQPLRASPAKFIAHVEPRTPYPLLTFLPHPGAPTDALVLLYFTVKQCRGTHPKHHCHTVELQPPLHTRTGHNLVSRSNDRVHPRRPHLVLVSIASRDF
jgi:hypothetical protein